MEASGAKTASDWVFVARSVEQLPGGEEQAIRCLARASILAETSSEWVDIALAWSIVCHDHDMLRESLVKAESIAEEGEDLVRIAGIWVEAGDIDQAIRIFRESEDPSAWQYLTELQGIHGGRNDGTTVLDWVEQGMTARSSSETVSEAAEYYNDNKTEAVRLLVVAEKQASSTRDWLRIARAWKNELESSDSANYCMDEAESAIDDGYDWISISSTWKNTFQDVDSAIACLEAAEDAAGDDEDCWELILNAWKDDYRDPESYMRCAEKCAIASKGNFLFASNALFDDFVREEFMCKQSIFTDLGTLSESSRNFVGIWTTETDSGHPQGYLARYYSFTLDRRGSVVITLEVDSEYCDEADLLLAEGIEPRGNVLGQNSGQWSRIRRDLGPGTYTIKASTDADTAFHGTEIFTLEITFSGH